MTGFTKLLSFVSKLHVHMGMLWASSLEMGRQGYHFQSCLFSFESRELVWSPASLWQHKKLEPVGRLLYLKIPFHQFQLYRKTTLSTTSPQNILKVSWKWKLHTGVSLFVSLRNRTGEERRRQNTCVWQTWQGYYVRVLPWSGSLQKNVFKGKWSLAKSCFKQT